MSQQLVELETNGPSTNNKNTDNSIIDLESTKIYQTKSLTQKRMLPTKHRKVFTITTRWGKLEIGFFNILSFIMMCLTIISLTTLAILCFYFSIFVAYSEPEVFYHVGQSSIELNRLNTLLNIMMNYKKGPLSEKFISQTNSTFIRLLNSFDAIDLDIYRINQLANIDYDTLRDEIYHLTFLFRYDGKDFMNSFENLGIGNETTFSTMSVGVNDTKIVLNKTLNIADQYVTNKNDYITGSSIFGLILTFILLIFMIPLSFSITFKTLRENEKLIQKLTRVDANAVKETILDTLFGPQFKDFCKAHDKLSFFLFLEKSLQYTEYCDNIYNLDNNAEISIEDTNDIQKIEIEIDKWQSKKCEIVFEIKTEFLSSKGEHFLGVKKIGGKKLIENVKKEFKSNPMNLPDNLFDEMESNISIHLFPTFKLFQTNQKETKRNRSYYKLK